MGIALIFVGAIFVIVGVRDQVDLFNRTIKDDLVGDPGEGNFVFWLAAIFVITAIGSTNESIKRVSDAFLGLVIVVLFLAASRNGTGGFFGQLTRQIQE